jgi:ribonuclease HII
MEKLAARESKDKSNPHNLDIEREVWAKGYHMIGGVDECGRGTFSGPVVAGCVILPKEFKIPRLTDSKKINKK